MSKAEKILIALLAIIVLIVGYIVFQVKTDRKILGGLSSMDNAYLSGSSYVNTSITSTVAVKVLSANYNRLFARCSNIGANEAFCMKTSTSTGVTATATIITANGGEIRFDANDPYLGELYCISSASETTLITCEDK